MKCYKLTNENRQTTRRTSVMATYTIKEHECSNLVLGDRGTHTEYCIDTGGLEVGNYATREEAEAAIPALKAAIERQQKQQKHHFTIL